MQDEQLHAERYVLILTSSQAVLKNLTAQEEIQCLVRQDSAV